MTWDLQLDVLDVWRKAGLPGLVEPYRSEQFCCAEALCNVPNDTVVARGVRLQLDGDGSTYCGVGDIVIKKRRTGQRSAVVQGINWDSKPVGIKRYKRAVWDVDLRVGHGGQQLVAHGKLTAEAADRGASTKRSLSTAAERGQPMVGGRYAGAGAPLGKPQATAGNESATMEGQPHKLFNNRLRIRKRKSGSDRRKLVGFTITDAIPFAEAASLHDSSHSLLADKPFHSVRCNKNEPCALQHASGLRGWRSSAPRDSSTRDLLVLLASQVPAELAGDRKKFKQFLTSIGVDGRPAVYTFAFRSPKRGLKLAYVGKASGGLLRRLLCYVGQYGAIGPASEPIKFLPWSWLQAHGCTVEVRFAYVSTGLNATR